MSNVAHVNLVIVDLMDVVLEINVHVILDGKSCKLKKKKEIEKEKNRNKYKEKKEKK